MMRWRVRSAGRVEDRVRGVGREWIRFDGAIAGAAFSSGDRIVIGCWLGSPFGPFVDAMWARPDGTRVLVAPPGRPLAFVASQYRFDEHVAAQTGARVSARMLRITAGPLALEMSLQPPGVVSALLALRPRPLRAAGPWMWVEDVMLRPLVGPLVGGSAAIRIRGRTPGGVRERYCIHDVRSAASVRASVDGVDLGPPTPPTSPAGFGFSEFPPRPALVRLTSLFEPGALDALPDELVP